MLNIRDGRALLARGYLGMWKKDENGNLVADDKGNPVLITADNQEKGFSLSDNNQYIESLKSESIERRKENSALKDSLKSFEGLNADEARKAIEKVKTFGEKDWLDASKVEEMKAELARSYTAQISERDAQLMSAKNQLNNYVVGQSFLDSQFIKDKVLVHADVVKNMFGNHFVVNEKNEVVALSDPSNKDSVIRSVANPLIPASVDEAIGMLINNYPHKDSILKSSGNSGGNAGGGNGGNVGVPKSYADCKTEAEQVAYLKTIN